jgi:NAD-dependent deacetylase
VIKHELPGLAEAVDLARGARRVVVLTGAGMSAESGVPTFREAQTGWWGRYSPEQLATEEAFLADPDLVWGWYRWRARLVRSCTPNAGHRAVATWQRRLAGAAGADGATSPRGSLRIATQNVDDLHERAGAEVLAHLHGSLFAFRCADCGEPAVGAADDDPSPVDAGRTAAERPAGLDVPEEPGRIAPPGCGVCGIGLVRPAVVWFEEMLPKDALAATMDALDRCDLAVVVGTSAQVQPAATLPYVALGAGAAVVEVNPAVTDFSTAATVHVPGTAATVLPALAAAVG